MKCIVVLLFISVLVLHLVDNTVQGAPHQSTEESEDAETQEDLEPSIPGHPEARHVPAGQSHELKSREREEGTSSEERARRTSVESDEDDSSIKIPKAEPLCPARPEEITNIEAECAEEYKQWKLMRMKKLHHTTTCEPTHMEELTSQMSLTSENSVAYEEVTTQSTARELEELQMTKLDDSGMTEGSTPEDDQLVTMETTTMSQTTLVPVTEARSMKRKRSRKIIKKRSCYPATCILRKLNLLDNMGQPSIEKIQSFAVNMTVDDSTNLEQKAVGCVKEINEAMIDATGDIGKKVGCVAQKVITCLNKGLACPIMKVPQ